MYELTDDKPASGDDVFLCTVCQKPFSMSELRQYVTVVQAMRADGMGCDMFQHNHGLRCSDCVQQMQEEQRQQAHAALLLRREREQKETEERKALYLRILSQNQQVPKDET